MIDQAYVDTVRLLLRVVPDIFKNEIFAMKGGTAINLFVQDMPRLSVDIDVVYVPCDSSREEALHAIANEITAIKSRLERSGLTVRVGKLNSEGETKLFIADDRSQVKVEVNTVFRGTVFPVVRRSLTEKTVQNFSTTVEAPVLVDAELYGSKIVAALDRQHPRDLFDVLKLYEQGELSQDTLEAVVIYLAGHNRPTHEVLFGTDKDISASYANNFVGMSLEETPSLEVLLDVRTRLRADIVQRLTKKHRDFLISLAEAEPDWTLLDCKHAQSLPGLRWKLINLIRFQKNRPSDFKKQAEALKNLLDR
jgi:predicted nucleotidyltransferase component of viral defense system